MYRKLCFIRLVKADPLQCTQGPYASSTIANEAHGFASRPVHAPFAALDIEPQAGRREGVTQGLLEHEIFRCADVQDALMIQQPEYVGATKGEIKVMAGQQHRKLLLSGKTLQQVEHLDAPG